MNCERFDWRGRYCIEGADCTCHPPVAASSPRRHTPVNLTAAERRRKLLAAFSPGNTPAGEHADVVRNGLPPRQTSPPVGPATSAAQLRVNAAHAALDELLRQRADKADSRERELIGLYGELVARADTAEAERDRFKKALEVYANEDFTYRPVTREYHSMYDNICDPSEAEEDAGQIARDALSGIEV